MNTIDELLSKLPEGATLTRRAYSWAVELPESKGYKSCGVTPLKALEHALGGEADREMASLKALAGPV